MARRTNCRAQRFRGWVHWLGTYTCSCWSDSRVSSGVSNWTSETFPDKRRGIFLAIDFYLGYFIAVRVHQSQGKGHCRHFYNGESKCTRYFNTTTWPRVICDGSCPIAVVFVHKIAFTCQGYSVEANHRHQPSSQFRHIPSTCIGTSVPGVADTKKWVAVKFEVKLIERRMHNESTRRVGYLAKKNVVQVCQQEEDEEAD